MKGIYRPPSLFSFMPIEPVEVDVIGYEYIHDMKWMHIITPVSRHSILGLLGGRAAHRKVPASDVTLIDDGALPEVVE